MSSLSFRLPSLNSICSQCRRRFPRTPLLTVRPQVTKRPLTRTGPSQADPPANESSINSSLSNLSFDPSFATDSSTGQFASASASRSGGSRLFYKPPPKPHHLHIFATKHNCHITLSAGNRNSIISVSAGNLNFRKAARGSYDAAFQLGAFVMAKIKNMGLLNDAYPGKGGPIRALEIVLRDFGPGREAVTKILMGQEGKELRKRVTRIMDATRLKFGGTRGKRRRRLG